VSMFTGEPQVFILEIILLMMQFFLLNEVNYFTVSTVVECTYQPLMSTQNTYDIPTKLKAE